MYKQFISSSYKKLSNGEDVLLINEAIRDENNVISKNTKHFLNPQRYYYLTKKEFRNYNQKKEFEPLERLDKIKIFNSNLISDIKNRLGLYDTNPKNVFNNPYIYGADINIEVLAKISYLNKIKDNRFIPLDVGFLDIETDINTDEIIIITVSHNNKIYTTFLKNRMFQIDETSKKMTPFDLDDVKNASSKEFEDLIKEHNLIFEYKVANTEIDMIEWIFEKIHENRTDFIGIWNLSFDIPKILDAIKKAGKLPEDIFSNPTIEKRFRFSWYKKAIAKVNHFSLNWSSLLDAGSTQFLDSLALYSILRKTSGFEASYKLDYILNKNLNRGKLSLGVEENHAIMQTRKFKDYIIYNQFDVIGLFLLELKNNDILNAYKRSDANLITDINFTTIDLKNNLYKYYLENENRIISSKGPVGDITEKYFNNCNCYKNKKDDKNNCIYCDEKIMVKKKGGLVLNPAKINGLGLPFKIAGYK